MSNKTINFIKKYYTAKEFNDYCRANNIDSSIGLFELYDKKGIFHPIYRIVYSDNFIQEYEEYSSCVEHQTDNVYNIHDILKVGIPNNEILAHLKLEEGVLGIVEGGKNAGVLAEVTRIGKSGLSTASIALRDLGGNQFETIIDYVFPVGKGESWITLQEDNSQ